MPASSASTSIDQLVERPGGEQADAEVEQLGAALVRGSGGCGMWLSSRTPSY